MPRNNTTPPTGNKTVYLDVMHRGRFLCQLAYQYCPLWPIEIETLVDYIYQQRPSLRNKDDITVSFSNSRVVR